jgi:radical SAM protein with 4Fe4S-binding SPASM domain
VLAGNVRRRPFSEIWRESTEMCRVRSMTESGLATCSACAIRAYCHRCPGLALLESGSLYGPDDRACELAQQTAQLAGTGEALSA